MNNDMKNKKECFNKFLRETLDGFFMKKDPYKNTCGGFKQKFPNHYNSIQTYPKSLIDEYVNIVISNSDIGFEKLNTIIRSKINMSEIIPYNSESNVNDLMMRYKLLISMSYLPFIYKEYITRLKEYKPFIKELDVDYYKRVYDNINSIPRVFLNNNNIYDINSNERNKDHKGRVISVFADIRVDMIYELSLKFDDSKNDDFRFDDIPTSSDDYEKKYIIKNILNKYDYVMDCRKTEFKSIDQLSKEYMIAAIIYLCTNPSSIKFYKKPENLLKEITGTSEILYKNSHKCKCGYKDTWELLSDFIRENMSFGFKIWLDCNPYTHPSATYENYHFVQGMEFLYVMLFARSPHSNNFRLEQFLSKN